MYVNSLVLELTTDFQFDELCDFGDDGGDGPGRDWVCPGFVVSPRSEMAVDWIRDSVCVARDKHRSTRTLREEDQDYGYG